MAEKTNSFSLIKGVCFAVGILIGMIAIKVLFDFSPIVGGALGGGLGALLGAGIYEVVSRLKQ